METSQVKQRPTKSAKLRGIRKRGHRWIFETRYRGHYLWGTCATPEMAQAALRAKMNEIDEDRFLDKKKAPTWTVDRLCNEYLKHCEKNRLKSIAKVRSMVRIIESHFGSDNNIKRITPESIEQWRGSHTPTAHAEQGGVVAANRMLGILRRMLALAVLGGEIPGNPAVKVKMFKEPKGRLRYLSIEEIASLLEVCSSRIRPVVELAILTGMRRGEILNLRREQVRLKEGFILLPDSKGGAPESVTLCDRAMEILRLVTPRADTSLVFAGKSGQPMDIKRAWMSALLKAKIKDCHFHDLRHTCASWLVMSGADMRTVQEQLRHKSPTMTARYSHLSQVHKKAAVEGLKKVNFPEKVGVSLAAQNE